MQGTRRWLKAHEIFFANCLFVLTIVGGIFAGIIFGVLADRNHDRKELHQTLSAFCTPEQIKHYYSFNFSESYLGDAQRYIANGCSIKGLKND